jgi:hypothetical protein
MGGKNDANKCRADEMQKKIPTTCAEIVCRPVNDCKSRGTRTSSGSGSAKESPVPSSSYIIDCPMLKNLEKRGNKGIDECKIDSNGKRGHSEMIAEPAVVADSGNDESTANRE